MHDWIEKFNEKEKERQQWQEKVEQLQAELDELRKKDDEKEEMLRTARTEREEEMAKMKQELATLGKAKQDAERRMSSLELDVLRAQQKENFEAKRSAEVSPIRRGTANEPRENPRHLGINLKQRKEKTWAWLLKQTK